MDKLLYEIEVKNKVKYLVENFYQEENKNEDAKKQMLAVCNFNLAQLSYYNPLDIKDIRNHFNTIKRFLFNIFDKNNEIDLFAIRLENLNFLIINTINKDIIDKITYEQIEYLTELKIYERYRELSITNYLMNRKGYRTKRKEYKRLMKYNELIKEEIIEIYQMFPCLWLVPYFAELFSKYK